MRNDDDGDTPGGRRSLVRSNSDPALAVVSSERRSSRDSPGGGADADGQRERARDDSHTRAPASVPPRPPRTLFPQRSQSYAVLQMATMPSAAAAGGGWMSRANPPHGYASLGADVERPSMDAAQRAGHHSVHEGVPVSTGPPVLVYLRYYGLVLAYLAVIIGAIYIQARLAGDLPPASNTLLVALSAAVVALTFLFTQIVMPSFFRDLFSVDEAGNAIRAPQPPCPRCGGQPKRDLMSVSHGNQNGADRRPMTSFDAARS